MKKTLYWLTIFLALGCTDSIVPTQYQGSGSDSRRPGTEGQQHQQGGNEEEEKPTVTPPENGIFESAAEAVVNMGAGWNLGNTLDSNSGDTQHMWIEGYNRNTTPKDYETAWGQPQATKQLMHMFKTAGFGAIRVPVTWYPHMGTITLHSENGKLEYWDMSTGWSGTQIDPVWMDRVQEVVDYVIDEGMYCILNVHHDTGEASTAWLIADRFDDAKDRYKALWEQIATRFKDYGQRLLFESYNEMLDSYHSWCFASFATDARYDASVAKAAYDGINKYASLFVKTVRETGGNNAQRNLVVNTYGACSGDGTWNSHLTDPLRNMALPEDSATGHIAVEVHSYWDSSKFGDSQKKEIDQLYTNLDTYITSRLGAPAIVGEWGGSGDEKDSEKNARFAEYFSSRAKDSGVAALFWMGLSDGKDRESLRWTMPNTKDAILSPYK